METGSPYFKPITLTLRLRFVTSADLLIKLLEKTDVEALAFAKLFDSERIKNEI